MNNISKSALNNIRPYFICHSNRKKLKLSTVVIICISLFLIGLTVTLSYTSVRSTKLLGRNAISISKQSIQENAKIFFLEITRRTAGAYSTYLNSVEDFVDILAIQLKEQFAKKNKKNKIPGKLEQHYNPDLYTQIDNEAYNCFYFGNKSELASAEIQLNQILSVFSLIKAIYHENSVYFQCIWVETSQKIHFEYPKYYEYKKINAESMNKYFKFIFSEYPGTKMSPSKKAVWTKPYKDISGKMNLDVYKMIYSDNGEFIASIGIDLNFSKFLSTITNNSLFSDVHQSLSEKIKSAHNKMEGFIFIAHRDGSILAFPNKYSNILSLPDMGYSKLKKYPDKLTVNLSESQNRDIKLIAEKFKKIDHEAENISLYGEEYIIAYSIIPTTNWILCFATKEQSLMSSVEETKKAIIITENKMTNKFIIISILFLFLFILLAVFFFKYYLLKPLYLIRNKIKEIGEGNFNTSLREEGFEEIADLAITFNNLTKELKDYTNNLEHEIKQRQSIETELEIAARLQTSVLPNITEEFINSKYELYAKLIPAKEMSGDFYDFFYISNNTLCLVAADVSGKGITAAFYMSMAKAIIKEECLKSTSVDTGKTMTRINRTLCNSVKTPMFLTMYLVFL